MKPLALLTSADYRLVKPIALELIHQGFAVCLHYHQTNDFIEPMAAELTKLGGQVYTIQLDLNEPDNVEDLFAKVNNLHHPLKVLINAISHVLRARIEDLSPADMDRAFALNLRTPWLCSRVATRFMEQDGGVIINVMDSPAIRTSIEYPAYAICVAGLAELTKIKAKTFAPKVRVNAMTCGLVLPSDNDVPPDDWKSLVERLPLKSIGKIDDVTSVIRFFIQSLSTTGSLIHVDGGYSLGMPLISG